MQERAAHGAICREAGRVSHESQGPQGPRDPARGRGLTRRRETNSKVREQPGWLGALSESRVRLCPAISSLSQKPGRSPWWTLASWGSGPGKEVKAAVHAVPGAWGTRDLRGGRAQPCFTQDGHRGPTLATPEKLLKTPAPGVLPNPWTRMSRERGQGPERVPTIQVMCVCCFAQLKGTMSWNI